MPKISKGKDPQSLGDPKVWAKGAMRGGGLGLFGDFLFSDVNRYGGGIVTSLAGPVFAQGEDAIQATVGNLQRMVRGVETKFGPDLARFLKMNMPGRSLWYTRLATERLIFDEIDRLVDPDAPQKFQRIQRRAEKEFGQQFFAPPGGGLERAPDIGAALGR
jgi:hypothetical protein